MGDRFVRVFPALCISIVFAGLLCPAAAGAATRPTAREARKWEGLAPGDPAVENELNVPFSGSFESTPDPASVSAFDELDAFGGNWYLGRTNDDPSQLAWGESYVLMAYLTMYEVTHDTKYLDKFILHGDAAINKTDKARGVRDYRGRSLRAWRAGGKFTVASVQFSDRTRHRVLNVISRSYNLNNYTLARIKPGTLRGRFTLVVNNPYIGTEIYRNVSLDRRSSAYVSRRVDAVSKFVTARVLYYATRHPATVPVPTHYRRAVPLFVDFADQTGMVAYPLARFYNVVKSDAALETSYSAAAVRMFVAARAAVAVHDGDWVDNGSYGYYRYRRGAPVWSDGVEMPHNKLLVLGRTILELYKATHLDTYRVRVQKLGVLLRAHLRTDQNGAYLWNYWWGRGDRGWSRRNSPSVYTPEWSGRPRVEDLGHAGLDVDFTQIAAAEGILFTRRDLIRFANTFHANMSRPDGTMALYVNGTGVEGAFARRVGIGGWLGLSPVSRNIFLRTNSVLAKILVDGDNRSGVVLSAVADNIKAKLALDEEPRSLLAPEVSLVTRVTPKSTIGGSFTMSIEATGEATPTVTFYVDAWRASVLTAPPYRRRYETRGLHNGYHVFRAVAADPEGRTAAILLPLFVRNVK